MRRSPAIAAVCSSSSSSCGIGCTGHPNRVARGGCYPGARPYIVPHPETLFPLTVFDRVPGAITRFAPGGPRENVLLRGSGVQTPFRGFESRWVLTRGLQPHACTLGLSIQTTPPGEGRLSETRSCEFPSVGTVNHPPCGGFGERRRLYRVNTTCVECHRVLNFMHVHISATTNVRHGVSRSIAVNNTVATISQSSQELGHIIGLSMHTVKC